MKIAMRSILALLATGLISPAYAAGRVAWTLPFCSLISRLLLISTTTKSSVTLLIRPRMPPLVTTSSPLLRLSTISAPDGWIAGGH